MVREGWKRIGEKAKEKWREKKRNINERKIETNRFHYITLLILEMRMKRKGRIRRGKENRIEHSSGTNIS